MLRPNRRQVIAGLGGIAAVGAGTTIDLRADTAAPVQLRSRLTSYSFDRPETSGLVSLADNGPPPVLRMQQHQEAAFDLVNGLDDYTTMHWHGIRLPNNMDGVPYLTQFPIAQNETYSYRFASSDAGTFWYHPHCMTMTQMARGLTGVLIVEEEEDPGFDQEIILNLKDFRIGDDGSLLDFFTPRGAARSGTTGNLRTVNWQITPRYTANAGSLVRLRIAVTDTTRIYKLVLPDIDGHVIAWNGHPVAEPMPMPSAETPFWLSPGERVDIALRLPDGEGIEIPIDTMIGRTAYPVCSLITHGTSEQRSLSDLKPLRPNPVAEPDLETAEMHEFLFGWSPEGDGSNNGFCGSYDYIFWSINRNPWLGDAEPGTGPLAELKLGKSYILRLRNESPNQHPIHLHGLVFKPIRSNMRRLPANYTDTVLLLKDEVIDIALVADNPGDWAFHCHVIEHQKTGLAGYIRVTG